MNKNATSSFASLSNLEPLFQNECESGLLSYAMRISTIVVKITRISTIVMIHQVYLDNCRDNLSYLDNCHNTQCLSRQFSSLAENPNYKFCSKPFLMQVFVAIMVLIAILVRLGPLCSYSASYSSHVLLSVLSPVFHGIPH